MKFFLWMTVVLVFSAAALYSEEIFISPFELQFERGGPLAERRASDDQERLSALLQRVMRELSSDRVAYKPLPSLSTASFNVLKRNIVQTKLEASVVCFYEKIDFLLFGTIAVDAATNTYSASFSLYSKKTNTIVKQMDTSAQAVSPEAFVESLAPLLDKDLQILFPRKVAIPEPTPVPREETTTPIEETTRDKIEKTPLKDKPPVKEEKTTESKSTETATAEEKTITPEKRKERLFGVQLSGGYYFMLQHEWQNAILPLVAIEIGVKNEMPFIDTDNFDFSWRLGGFFHYSFATYQPNAPYIHFHTLKLKGEAELYFQFSEFFAFFFGGGVLYRADIIDYQDVARAFFTDVPYALGFWALAGFEFTLNAEGTLSMGITNTLDFTLYSMTDIEYNLLLHFLFKI